MYKPLNHNFSLFNIFKSLKLAIKFIMNFIERIRLPHNEFAQFENEIGCSQSLTNAMADSSWLKMSGLSYFTAKDLCRRNAPGTFRWRRNSSKSGYTAFATSFIERKYTAFRAVITAFFLSVAFLSCFGWVEASTGCVARATPLMCSFDCWCSSKDFRLQKKIIANICTILILQCSTPSC